MFEDVGASGVGAKEEDAGRRSSSHTLCPWGHSVISASIGADGGRWERHGGEGCSVREPADGCLARDRCPRSSRTLESWIQSEGKGGRCFGGSHSCSKEAATV